MLNLLFQLFENESGSFKVDKNIQTTIFFILRDLVSYTEIKNNILYTVPDFFDKFMRTTLTIIAHYENLYQQNASKTTQEYVQALKDDTIHSMKALTSADTLTNTDLKLLVNTQNLNSEINFFNPDLYVHIISKCIILRTNVKNKQQPHLQVLNSESGREFLENFTPIFKNEIKNLKTKSRIMWTVVKIFENAVKDDATNNEKVNYNLIGEVTFKYFLVDLLLEWIDIGRVNEFFEDYTVFERNSSDKPKTAKPVLITDFQNYTKECLKITALIARYSEDTRIRTQQGRNPLNWLKRLKRLKMAENNKKHCNFDDVADFK